MLIKSGGWHWLAQCGSLHSYKSPALLLLVRACCCVIRCSAVYIEFYLLFIVALSHKRYMVWTYFMSNSPAACVFILTWFLQQSCSQSYNDLMIYMYVLLLCWIDMLYKKYVMQFSHINFHFIWIIWTAIFQHLEYLYTQNYTFETKQQKQLSWFVSKLNYPF